MTPTETLPLAQAADGFRTSLASHAVRVGCKALSVVVLARLVSPADHGLFAMAAAIFYVAALFRDLGLGAAAIQARELAAGTSTALWYAHLGIGVVLAVAILAGSPAIARFYDQPEVRGLLIAVSASFLLLGFSGPARILLTRQLRFAELNRAETRAAVAGTAAMIAAGFAGAGAYAFAIFLLVSEALLAFTLVRLAAWRPAAAADWSGLRTLLRPGFHLTAYNVLNSLALNLDTVLIGRWTSAAAVGFYTRSGQLLALAAQHVAAPLAGVMTATLARLSPASPEFAAHLRATVSLIGYLTLPLTAFCAAVPDDVLRLVLGGVWTDAAPLLRLLALSAAANAVTATLQGLCLATGRTSKLVTLAAISGLLTLAALWFNRANGIVALVGGLVAVNVLLLVPRVVWSTRGTPVSPGDYAVAHAGPLAFSAALGLGAWAVRQKFDSLAWAPRLLLALIGGVVAAGLVAIVWPRVRRELAAVWQHAPFARPR